MLKPKNHRQLLQNNKRFLPTANGAADSPHHMLLPTTWKIVIVKKTAWAIDNQLHDAVDGW